MVHRCIQPPSPPLHRQSQYLDFMQRPQNGPLPRRRSSGTGQPLYQFQRPFFLPLPRITWCHITRSGPWQSQGTVAAGSARTATFAEMEVGHKS
ncbi:hypothetical protein G647_06969 [Cladophialophora carrionii CBS 160.54]|uniref:Uncharacterized protein n=1 Tax=Cladophialophora carrionii CBS 160.54 TaxID=1279043 RepID=V9D3N6_9EURO|nr:uncharacterized protein G647_06969 [Cladophialophora carrionii CBS 160.54]ETI20627.1 hypothetical protein G647_06969 [Cladophialophora carrionii CBS 160.54]